MTKREQEILSWIRENPLISQQELAQRAGITRSSVAVHISNLMRKGLIRGRGYLLGEGAYVAVVGAVNVDIGGTPDSALVPADSNPGRVTVTLGGVGRNIAENLCRLGKRVLMVTAWRMNDWEGIRYLLSHRFKSGISQFFIAMIATVAADLTVAILVGIVYSALLYIVKASHINVSFSDIDASRLPGAPCGEMPRAGVAYVTGSLFFGAVDESAVVWVNGRKAGERIYQNPDDWKQCWFEVEKLHGNDIGCPEGVHNGFNIDAVINAAYVVIGLLYGEGDFGRTMEIATRCGQDSDCNPASAAGILGVMYGYDAIPEYWKKGAEKIADMPFPYTSLSLDGVCDMNMDLLKALVSENGGSVQDGQITFTVQKPEEVRYEQSFEGLSPVEKRILKKTFTDELELVFEGNSVVVSGSVVKTGHDDSPYVARLSAYVDGELVEKFSMPYDYITRKYEIFYRYCMPSGRHVLKLVLENPHPDYAMSATEMTVYDEI